MMHHATALLAAICIAAHAPGSNAQAFPAKQVRIVVTIAAGSTADILARVVAEPLARQLGQSVVIENRPGAGGNIAGEYVAKQPADGYTLLLATISSHGINPGMYRKMPYDAINDFSHVIAVASVPNVLIVSPALSINTVGDLVRLAQSKPGELAFSSGGNGTSHHLGAELFNSMAGIRMLHVPFKGTPEAVSSVMRGETAIMFPNIPNALELVKDGRLKALAVTSEKRLASWPEMPTMIELGFKDFELTAWYGIVAPAKTPETVVTRLNAEIQKTLELPSVREALAKYGFEILGGSADKFRAFNRGEIEKWGKVVRASGATVN